MTKRAIIARITGQKITSLLQIGSRKIEVPYYFTEVPEHAFGAIINDAQHHRVVDETDWNIVEDELVQNLKYSLEEYLSEYASQFNLESRIMEEDDEPDEGEVIFLLIPDEEE